METVMRLGRRDSSRMKEVSAMLVRSFSASRVARREDSKYYIYVEMTDE